MAEEVIVLVEATSVICCSCGERASPDQKIHDVVVAKGNDERKGCGKQFTHLATFWGDDVAKRWKNYRKDLTYKGVGYYQEGKFVLWVAAKHAAKHNWQKFSEA